MSSRYAPIILVVLVLAASVAFTVTQTWPSTPTYTTPSSNYTVSQPSSSTTHHTSSSPIQATTAYTTTYSQTQTQESSTWIRKFSSYSELADFIEKSYVSSAYVPASLPKIATLEMPGLTPMYLPPATATVTVPTAVRAALETSGSEVGVYAGKVRYSKTNIQVPGVDEADIVKCDGKFIYVGTPNSIYVVKAFPPENSGVTDVVRLGERSVVKGLFVLTNESTRKLVVITSTTYWKYVPLTESIELPSVTVTRTTRTATLPIVTPPETATTTKVTTVTVTVTATVPPIPPKPPRIVIPNTSVLVYEVSSEGKLTMLSNITVSGQYVTSRLIGDKVYVITSQVVAPPIEGYGIIPPLVNGSPVDPSLIIYLGAPPPYTYTLVAAVDLSTLKHKEHVFLTGRSDWIYVSTGNLYVLSARHVSIYEITWSVIKELLPEIPADIRGVINSIMNSSLPYYSKISAATNIFQSWLRTLKGDEAREFAENVREVGKKVLNGRVLEETVIYRFAIKGLDVVAEAKGSVPGYVLDQFSMDEYGKYFRIATTSRRIYIMDNAISTKTSNNIYILNMNLSIIGKLEELAPGERIYAARYLGSLAYLVTYRRVDPLYGIDLSNPEKPKVIGYLKIPGYSEYLHPYRGKYLIGIGVAATESGRPIGIKVSLFNISNPRNITEVSSIVIKGDLMTPLFHDHKAILINYDRNYIAFPIHGYIEGKGKLEGVSVISLGSTLKLKGVIEHRWAVRALYIENYIYSISLESIKIFDDSTLKLVKEVNLAPKM